MISLAKNDYAGLALESSNLMMLADSRIALGRYEEAAYRFRQAGDLRQKMGDAKNQDQEFDVAAQDWLSAAACFIGGFAPNEAKVLVAKVRQLVVNGKVGDDRLDSFAALPKREQQIAEIENRMSEFTERFDVQGNSKIGREEDPLQQLLALRRNLAGFKLFHFALFAQASEKGQKELALEHLEWLVKFDRDNPDAVALLGNQYTEKNKMERAIAVGKKFLSTGCDVCGAVRLMIANAFIRLDKPNWSQALDTLKDFDNEPAVKDEYRIIANGISAASFFELGNTTAFENEISELDRQERKSQSKALRDLIKNVRKIVQPVQEQDANGQFTRRGKELATEIGNLVSQTIVG